MKLDLFIEAAFSACLLYQVGREFAPWAAQRPYTAALALGGAALTAAVSAAAFQPGADLRCSPLDPAWCLALALGSLAAVLRFRDAALACPVGILRGSDGPGSPVCPAPAALALAGFLFGLGLALQWRLQAALLPGYGILLIEARWKRGAWPAWRTLGRILSPPFFSALFGMALGRSPLLPSGLGNGEGAAILRSGLNPGSGSGGVLGGLWRLFLVLGSQWTWPGLLALSLGWALFFRKKPWMAAGLFSLLLAPVLFSADLAPALSYLMLIQTILGLGLAGFMAVPPLRRWLGLFFLAAAGAAFWRLRA